MVAQGWFRGLLTLVVVGFVVGGPMLSVDPGRKCEDSLRIYVKAKRPLHFGPSSAIRHYYVQCQHHQLVADDVKSVISTPKNKTVRW